MKEGSIVKKNERGAIVVEATISLSIFMFAIVTLLSVVNICYAQAKISVAINTTAKEISQYSYLYGLTGLNQKQAELYAGSESARTSIDNTLESVTTLFDSVSEIGDSVSGGLSDSSQTGSAFDEISSALNSGESSLQSIQSELESVASDPKEFIIGCAKLLGNGVIEEFKSKAIAAPLAKSMVQKHLVSSSSDNCESFLKHLGVVPVNDSYLSGLDFSDSVIFLNGSDDIKVIVHYDIQVIQLLGIDIKFSFTQCAATKAWFTGVSSAGASTSSESQADNSSDTVASNEENSTSKSYDDYAKEGTHNNGSNQVILGTYTANFAEENYIDTARAYSATYFSLDDWDEISETVGSGNMWYINQAFLEQQEAVGKTFYLIEDPYYATGYLGNEVTWLESQGYTFDFDPGVSMWKAVRN